MSIAQQYWLRSLYVNDRFFIIFLKNTKNHRSSAGPLYTQTMALYYCAVQVDKAAVDAQYPNGTDDIPSKGGAGDAARKFLGQYCQVVKQVDGTPEGQ